MKKRMRGSMQALEESVPTLEVHEVRVLHGKLEQAMLAFQRRRDEVAESLGEIKRSRRALSSYDHIKTFDKEQGASIGEPENCPQAVRVVSDGAREIHAFQRRSVVFIDSF